MNTYVIQESPNPTADFYFPNRNKKNDIYLNTPPEKCSFLPTDTVIFIRYISARWLRYFRQLAAASCPNLIFFIDDDVFDLNMHRGLPWRYRWKLFHLAAKHKKQLIGLGFSLWVSTPWLQEKYLAWQPKQLEPLNPYIDNSRKEIVFYHGTASHQAEIEWLVPIIEQVTTENNQLVFELIGNKHTQRLFKDIPAVHVYHPMPWYSYCELIRLPGRIIGLAPLLETPFNQARSASKFFDITQAGAIGLYANNAVYAQKITHNQTGFLLAMQQEVWVEHILHLAANPTLRLNILRNAQKSARMHMSI